MTEVADNITILLKSYVDDLTKDQKVEIIREMLKKTKKAGKVISSLSILVTDDKKDDKQKSPTEETKAKRGRPIVNDEETKRQKHADACLFSYYKKKITTLDELTELEEKSTRTLRIASKLRKHIIAENEDK